MLAVILFLTMVPNTKVSAAVANQEELPFGSLLSDWDFNRVKAIDGYVYALNHNEYLEYKMLGPIPRDIMGKKQIYFEFSYPYNCKAEIQLYKIEDEKNIKDLRSNEVVDMYEGMNEEMLNIINTPNAYLGTVCGKTLQNHITGEGGSIHTKNWSLQRIEEELTKLNNIQNDKTLKSEQIYGYTGKAYQDVLQQYSQAMNITNGEAKDTISDNNTADEEVPDTVSDNNATEEEERVSENNIDQAVSSGDVLSNTYAENDIMPMDADSDTPFSYCAVHNYILWNGYIEEKDKPGEAQYIGDTSGVYLMVVHPTESYLSEDVVYLPFEITEKGSTVVHVKNDNVLKEIYGDRMLYVTLAAAMGGDPVDLVNGSLEWNYTDISMEGAEPMEFGRSYSSLYADVKGVLGNGWTHPYNYRMESFYGTVRITLPNGTQIDFVQEYDGSYTKIPGSAYSLENVTGGYLLYRSDGTKIRFDGSGLPVEMTDIHENVTTLENNGSQITKITTKAGSFSLAYSGDLLTYVTDSAGRSVAYTYAGTDLTTMTNTDGDTMTFSYDENHNLIRVTGFTGEEMLSNTYNEEHQVVSQTMPDLGTYTYSYDKEGRTTTHTAENGLKQTVVYDEKNRIVQDTDNDGTIIYTYDDFSRRSSETDRKGNVVSYTYEGDTTNIETLTYPDGTTESYTYNEKNQPITKKQKDGTIVTFGYDGRGNLITYTDAAGNIYTYEYDANNYCTKETDPLGNSTVYTYNEAGCPLTITDSLGNTTVCSYDGVGRILTKTSPEGRETSYTYSQGGKLLTVTDPAGNQQTYRYTGNGFAINETDKLGNSASYTYSAMNRMETATDREEHQKVYTYDRNGEMATGTDADGNKTLYTYDYKGRKVTNTNGNGDTTIYAYDSNGNMTGSTSAEGFQNSYVYDSMNRLTEQTDANDGKKRYTYDSMGRLLTATDAEGGITTYAYDSVGNMTSVKNARGFTTTYVYDSANRMTGMTDAMGNTVSYVYDNAGQCIKTIRKDTEEATIGYDKDGNPVKITDEAGGEILSEYDALGRVTGVTDVLGNRSSYTYDANGNLLSFTDQNGVTISYTYDKENRPVSMTDGEGNHTVYTYQKNGWLSNTTDAQGGVTGYTYDGAGNVTEVKDPMGYRISYVYDKDGRVVSATDRNGSVTQFAYDGNGNLITVTNPDGGVEHYSYDNNDRMTGYTDAEGYTITYGYDANGNMVMVTDARGNVFNAEYDALDRKISTTNALGGQILLTFDVMDRITKAENEDGAVTEYSYDVFGRVTEMKDAMGNSTCYTYDKAGNLLSMTDQAGTTRSYTYDKIGNVLTYTDGLGAVTTYEYDKNYNLIKTTDSAGAATCYTYDAMNRVIKETDALGNSKFFTYDKNGRIIRAADKNGNVTKYTLDGNGNILCQTDALGHPSYFEYDSMNRMTKITLYAGEETDEDGNTELTGEQVTLYTYDHRGLVTTEINAAGNGKYYVYDESGNMVSVTDEDGYVTAYNYDALNHLSGTDYNGTKQASFLYNATGELVEMTDWNGTTKIKRDLLNRIEEVKDHNSRVTGYTWDGVGNLTAISYPQNQGMALYTYDAEGNQLTATGTDGRTFTFSYDDTGNLTSKSYPNGERERYQYDALHQLVRIDEYDLNGKQKTYTEYSYDGNGNRTGDCNRVPTIPTSYYLYIGNKGTWGGEWNSYTYDALNRLTKEYEHDTALTILYDYDSLGNKTYEKNSQDEKFYTYNELNQLVAKEAYNRTTNYEYDKRGNRTLESSINTQENRRTFEWDETNRLVKGTRGPDYGMYTSEYTYNALGLRVNSTIMGPEKTIYERDYVIDYTSPEHNDLAEYNMGHYQWQGDKKVHDMTNLYNAAGQRLQTESIRYVEWAGAKKYVRYIHEDVMGSGYYYTNPENGYVTNKHEYTTWGNNTKAPTYNYDPEYRVSEPYFTGHPYDGSLNLYFAENRFYDPETGSFLSKDPAKSGLNWYQYCGSNPTTYVDPLGLFPTTIEEDDPFFFSKMEDSGKHGRIDFDLLRQIDEISVDDFDTTIMKSKEAWKEQQLLTAKYLTFFMLNDPSFTKKTYGNEMMYAVVGNMFQEAYPGKTEQYNDNGSLVYMQKTLKYTIPISASTNNARTYRDIVEKCEGWANDMETIDLLQKFPNIEAQSQGFGFGMLQFTYERASQVLQMYQDNYQYVSDDLTMGQCFAVEYQLLRNELNGYGDLIYKFDELVEKSQIEKIATYENRISTLGTTFRTIYENPGDNSKQAGGDKAKIWLDIIRSRNIRGAIK